MADPADPADPVNDDARAITRLAMGVARSARASGKSLANAFMDMAPRIPVRDLATLRAQHGGLEGQALADELVRRASRVSAAIGATSGAVMSAEQFAPPAWVMIPLELVVETLAVAAVELKLVAELHEAYERPVQGTATERTTALVRAWAERRGVTPWTFGRRGGLADALGRSTRVELVRIVRRRLVARLGRNVSSLAPLFAGAVAGAEVNRRATRSLGETIARDLAPGTPASPPTSPPA